MSDMANAAIVQINYRLGVFGTFGYSRLDGSGTFGIQDQRAALEWVQRNAAEFGGRPQGPMSAEA